MQLLNILLQVVNEPSTGLKLFGKQLLKVEDVVPIVVRFRLHTCIILL